MTLASDGATRSSATGRRTRGNGDGGCHRTRGRARAGKREDAGANGRASFEFGVGEAMFRRGDDRGDGGAGLTPSEEDEGKGEGATRAPGAGRVGAAGFDSGPGVASFAWMSEGEYEEYEDGHDHGHSRPGAGRVGMAGFDGGPGFASFTWMSEGEYEEYEDGHDHGHSHDGREEEEVESAGPGLAPAPAASAKSVPPPLFDTETKTIYAGIATASAFIAAKNFGFEIPKFPKPSPPTATASVAPKQRAAASTKQQKQIVGSTASQMTMDSAFTENNIRQISGAALVSTAVIAAVVRLSESKSSQRRRRQSAASQSDFGMRSLQRLEELREAMLIEFREEQRQLGIVQQGKTNKLKGLEDSFKSTLKEVKQNVIRQEATIYGISEQSAEDQARALAMLMKEHEVAMKAQAAAFEKQEAALKANMTKLEAALKETATALAEVKEAIANMASRHETELRAARGLIRAERELGRSEASKYCAARDLQNAHVNALRSDLALAQLNSTEKFAFLERQLKDICGSYSARIIKEREMAAAKLSQELEQANEEQLRMLTAYVAENKSTPRPDLIAAVAELRAEAEVEKASIAAKYESALRGAVGERRALKALYESERQKVENNSTALHAEMTQLRGLLAAAEVSSSQKLNEDLRKAQADFEQRVASLKKDHIDQLVRAQRSSSTAGGGDSYTNAFSESHQVALSAMQKAHAKALNDALAEADKRVADAEVHVRERIANMKSASNAEKAQLLAKFEDERNSVVTEVQSEQSATEASILQVKQQYENLLVEAVAQVQSIAAADTEKLRAALKASAGERRELYSMMRSEALKTYNASKVDYASEVVATEARTAAYWEQKIKDVEAAKDAQMRQLRQSYEQKMENARAGMASGTKNDELVAIVAKLKQELDEQSARAERTLVEAVAEIQSLADADKAVITALVKTEAEDAFKAEKQALITAHALEVETIKNAIRTSLTGDEAMRLKQVEDLVKAKLDEAQVVARNVSQISASSAQSTIAQLEKRLAEIQTEHNAKIVELNNVNKAAAMKSEDDLRKQIAAAKKDLDKFKRETKSSKQIQQTLPESVTYTFKGSDADMKRIRKERDSLQEKVTRLEEEYAKKVASTSTSGSIAELQAELKKARAEREQDLQAMVKRMEAERAESERVLRAEIAAARGGIQTAESQYNAALEKASATEPSTSTSSVTGFWSMFKGRSVDARIKEQSELRAAAEGEVKDARERESKLRAQIDALTSDFERKSSQAANEVTCLKEQLNKALSDASKALTSSSENAVQEYERRIRELEASGDKTITVVAKLQAEAEMELTSTVARLMAEREQVAAMAQKKFAAELAKVKSEVKDEAAKLAEASALQIKIVTAQQDVITWKDQANAYKVQVTKLQTERLELLSKLKNSQDALANNIAETVKEAKAHEDEILRAVAKATVDFNAKLQVSQEKAREAESKLLNLRNDFELRAREVAKQTTKELKEREAALEKRLVQAQRDYAQQAKLVESLEQRLTTSKLQMTDAEASWARAQRAMADEFEQRLKKETVPLAEKIVFYERRVEALSQELKAAKKSAGASASADRNAPAPVIIKRALFEFNRSKLQAEAEAREQAERALTMANEEMRALKAKLQTAKAEAEAAKEEARKEAEKNAKVSPFEAMLAIIFGGISSMSKPAATEKAAIVAVEVTRPQAIQAELDAALKTLNELKSKQKAEIAAAEAAVRKAYESKLTALKDTVVKLESQLANADKVAEAKLAAAMKAAEQVRTDLEKELRSEIAAAKQLAATAKSAAEREYQIALSEAQANAKKELDAQAREAAAARMESEKKLRESSENAIGKLKERIAEFDARLDARDEEIEAKFNKQFDKLVDDFRREVEALERRAEDAEKLAMDRVQKDSEKLVMDRVRKEAEKLAMERVRKDTEKANVVKAETEDFSETIAKTREEIAAVRAKSQNAINELRSKYESELQDAIAAKDLALKQSREEAAMLIASEKTKAEQNLQKQLAEREAQMKADRQRLERSFEKTASERDAKDAEIAALKKSLDQAKKKLREFMELSDEERIVLDRSKKVATELDSLKSRYASTMGVDVGDSRDEVELTMSSVKSTTTTMTAVETMKSSTDYFQQLLDMSASSEGVKKK